MDVRELGRSALDVWLKGARLPLTMVERVAKRDEDTSSWPPSIAFEKLEATVKGVVGRVVRDEQLSGQARLQRAEVAKREEALARRAQAAGIRQSAQQRARAARQEISAARQAVEEQAEEREQHLEAARAAAQQQIDDRTASKKAGARKVAAARTEAVDAKAKQAEQRRLRDEAKALRAKEQAVEARREVLDLDAAVDAKKAARRAG